MKALPTKLTKLAILMIAYGIIRSFIGSIEHQFLFKGTQDFLDPMLLAFIVASANTLNLLLLAFFPFKNPPSLLNKWLMLLLIMSFKLNGIVIYLILIGIDYIKESNQTEPELGAYGENAR